MLKVTGYVTSVYYEDQSDRLYASDRQGISRPIRVTPRLHIFGNQLGIPWETLKEARPKYVSIFVFWKYSSSSLKELTTKENSETIYFVITLFLFTQKPSLKW